MCDEDLFDKVVAETVDANLSPHLLNTNSPRTLSSVGSQSTAGCPTVPNSPIVVPSSSAVASNLIYCPHPGCKKTYKTAKGYDNHIFVHKITDYNTRKPDCHGVVGALDDMVSSILLEIKQEPYTPEPKGRIITELLECQGKADWVHFLQALSEPILELLTKQTKLIPSNQYEEFLSHLNNLMNGDKYLPDLKEKLSLLLCENSVNQKQFVSMILYRLCVRLGEEVQLLILKEMSLKSKSNYAPPAPVMEGNELILFTGKVSSIIRSYFSKGNTIPSVVWRVRCQCIRQRFIVCEEEIHGKDIIQKSLWMSGTINPCQSIVDFCSNVENVISDLMKSGCAVSPDVVVEAILQPSSCNIAEKWNSLTEGFLSELDSIIFMRDFVSILIKISVRLEETRLQRAEQERRRQQKFSTRDNLKRN